MEIIKRYLEHLSQKTESIFPIDSVSSGRPFNVSRFTNKKRKRKQNLKKTSIIGGD